MKILSKCLKHDLLSILIILYEFRKFGSKLTGEDIIKIFREWFISQQFLIFCGLRKYGSLVIIIFHIISMKILIYEEINISLYIFMRSFVGKGNSSPPENSNPLYFELFFQWLFQLAYLYKDWFTQVTEQLETKLLMTHVILFRGQ